MTGSQTASSPLPAAPLTVWPRPEIRAVVAQAAQAIRDHQGACEAAQDLTPEAVIALRGCGYPAFCVPTELGGVPIPGGLGAVLSEFGWAQEQLGAAGASLALVLAMNGQVLGSAFAARSLPGEMLRRLGTAAVQGALINAVASEPALGSPSRGGMPETALSAHGAGFLLSGHKTWATGARALNFALVTARTPQQEVARALIDLSAPGVRIEATWNGSLSLRGSGSQDLYLDAVAVPGADVVPPQPQHPAHPAWFWTALAGTYLGVGTAALEALISHSRLRVPTALGAPLSSLPRVREATGRIAAELSAARALLREATRAFEFVPDARSLPLLAAAKALCTGAAVFATDQAARAVGGAALAPGLPFERLLRDARAGLTHPPTDPEAFERLGQALLDDVEADAASLAGATLP
ncbi:acyl-CoA dehydrogenase family protein [Deinococcus sp.]|uniref:acyl-CoA dehydrogenase family protein n=1 Tax=Deinococcus sp. TaxID=47478 RepID=UPI0025D22778|nr:acyl-CoA dehydrogenase family protein [Deinococcus sp.]